MWWVTGLACNSIIVVAVGVGSWRLGRARSSLGADAVRSDELHRHEQEAVQLNDAVLQGLVVAKMSLELGQRERAMAALESSISAASAMITNLLEAQAPRDRASLLRSGPVTLEERA